MRLTPQEPEDGFTEVNDLFAYADFGARFANLVGTTFNQVQKSVGAYLGRLCHCS